MKKMGKRSKEARGDTDIMPRDRKKYAAEGRKTRAEMKGGDEKTERRGGEAYKGRRIRPAQTDSREEGRKRRAALNT